MWDGFWLVSGYGRATTKWGTGLYNRLYITIALPPPSMTEYGGAKQEPSERSQWPSGLQEKERWRRDQVPGSAIKVVNAAVDEHWKPDIKLGILAYALDPSLAHTLSQGWGVFYWSPVFGGAGSREYNRFYRTLVPAPPAITGHGKVK